MVRNEVNICIHRWLKQILPCVNMFGCWAGLITKCKMTQNNPTMTSDDFLHHWSTNNVQCFCSPHQQQISDCFRHNEIPIGFLIGCQYHRCRNKMNRTLICYLTAKSATRVQAILNFLTLQRSIEKRGWGPQWHLAGGAVCSAHNQGANCRQVSKKNFCRP
jgi:hypothetical protein